MISVLCTNRYTLYSKLVSDYDIDLWNIDRDAYNFNGKNKVITHAPCAQWSRMKGFAKGSKLEKDLAFFCLEKVKKNGGIFEHPAHSSFFKEAGIKKYYEVDQLEFGFVCRKKTWLFFHDCEPLVYIPQIVPQIVKYHTAILGTHQSGERRSTMMTKSFCEWLILSATGDKRDYFLA